MPVACSGYMMQRLVRAKTFITHVAVIVHALNLLSANVFGSGIFH